MSGRLFIPVRHLAAVCVAGAVAWVSCVVVAVQICQAVH